MSESSKMLIVMGWIFGSIGGFILLLGAIIGIAAHSLFVPFIMAATGVPFAAIGGGLLGYQYRVRAKVRALREGGTRVLGTIRTITPTATWVNNEQLMSATVAGDDGQVYRSNGFLASGGDWAKGDRITVLVDPADPQRYLVDLEPDSVQDLPRRDDGDDELLRGPLFPQLPPS